MSGLLVSNRKNGIYRDPFFGLARDFFGFDVPKAAAKTSAFAPNFDVKETESAYVLAADLPGVKEDAIELTLDGRTLTIAGSRESEVKEENDNFHVYERRFGSFSRSFALPAEASADAVTADLKDGVLTVNIAKKPEAQARKIAIKKG